MMATKEFSEILSSLSEDEENVADSVLDEIEDRMLFDYSTREYDYRHAATTIIESVPGMGRIPGEFITSGQIIAAHAVVANWWLQLPIEPSECQD